MPFNIANEEKINIFIRKEILMENYLVIPYYKNKAYISFIKQFSSKEEVVEFLGREDGDLIRAIHGHIENSEKTNKEKSYDFVCLDNNLHYYILYISDDGNKLFEPELLKNGKYKLKKINIKSDSIIPENKVFNFEG